MPAPRRSIRVNIALRRRGFTLIEALLVVAVLAILAGLIVPRMGGITRRQETVAVDRVADLLTMFAFRSSAGKQPVGLMYDGRSRTFELLILDIDPTQRGDPVVWQPDRLSMPAPLPEGMELAFAREDLSTLPDTEWMIATKPGGERLGQLAARLGQRALGGCGDLASSHFLGSRRGALGRRDGAHRELVGVLIVAFGVFHLRQDEIFLVQRRAERVAGRGQALRVVELEAGTGAQREHCGRRQRRPRAHLD